MPGYGSHLMGHHMGRRMQSMQSMGDEPYGHSGGMASRTATGKGLEKEVSTNLSKIARESSEVACQCNHGLMVEIMKKYMFTK